ncbi:MAG: DsbA family protein [Chloroflexi bacterium]|nr:DsbA family protein [Chloroflexota bacterium]
MSKSTARKRRAQPSSNSTYWIIGGVIAAAVVVLGLVLINLMAAPRTPGAPAQTSAGRVLGNANAPVTIDMYSDFQCPVCRRAELTIKGLASKYIDTGKARVVYHNFAFIGNESTRAALAAECANEQGKFWDYATYVFDHQAGENKGAFADANLKRFAEELKLDTTTFNACFDSSKHAALIQQELNEGKALGIKATPSFFINGQFVEGLLSPDQFAAVIESFIPKQ